MSQILKQSHRMPLSRVSDELVFEYESELSFVKQLHANLEPLRPSIEKDLMKV